MRILIVEPELHGHKAFYLALILKAFQEHTLTVLTQPEHPALQEQVDLHQVNLQNVRFIPATSREPSKVFLQACQQTRDETYEHVFINYLDHYLSFILSTPQALHERISGIWFHPYALDTRYRWMPPLDKRSRQRGQLHRKLRCPKASAPLRQIFFLDTDAPARLEKLNPKLTSSCLPDPGEREPRMSKSDARDYFHLPHKRTIYLHAGSPEKRKGLPDVLQAFKRLIRDPAARERVFLLRVGPNERLGQNEKAILQELIEIGCAHSTDGFVSSQDFIEYFAAADVILIPYRKFRFSSGILANAKAAARSVIASRHGLIGTQVDAGNLGLTYTMFSGLEQAIRTFLNRQHTVSPDDISVLHAQFCAISHDGILCSSRRDEV